MNAILNRLKEPSTWTALGGLALLAGVDPDTFEQWVLAITGLAAFIGGVFFPERGGKDA